jgi:integrase/recombinase XerD
MPNFLPLKLSGQPASRAIADVDTSKQKPNPALLYVLTLGSEQSRQRVLKTLNQIAHEFGYADVQTCAWERMRFADIGALKSRWQALNKAPATINLAIALLRGVAKQAWLADLMSDKDYMAISMTKGARGSRLAHGRALTPLESSKLIDACMNDGTAIGKRDAALFAVSIGCGLRRNELRTLKLSNIDHVEHALHVLGKGNKERIAFCPVSVWTILTDWLAVRGSEGEAVFCCVKKGGKIDPESQLSTIAVYQLMVRRARALGIDLAPHDLRRTFATRLFEMGGDANLVRKAMGHASITTTQRYDKRDDKAVQSFVAGFKL